MPRSGPKVLVVGGGVIGVVSAIALQRVGFQVTLIERDEIGRGASFGNAGCLNPSSLVPIAMPGMLKQVPKWILNPLGPLAVRWSYLPKSLPWLLRFIHPGSMDVIRGRAHALTALLAPAVDGMESLAREAGMGGLIRRSGVMFLYRSRDGYLKDARSWKLRRDNGIDFQEVEMADLRASLPQIADDLTFGVFIPGNGYIRNPHRLVEGLAASFAGHGGNIIRGSAHRFVFNDGIPVAIRTDSVGDIEAETFVVAAGAYSGPLAAQLGDHLPLETERGYHVTISDPEAMLPMPVMNVEDKFYATPMESGLRIAGTVEIAGLARPPDWRRAQSLLKLGRRTFPGLASRNEADRVSRWMGHRPSLPDTLPAIGHSRRSQKVIYAFGHGHIGMSAAPMTANIVAALATGKTPPIEIERFDPSRFKAPCRFGAMTRSSICMPATI